jgi:uncharacterized protein (DUF924 family)
MNIDPTFWYFFSNGYRSIYSVPMAKREICISHFELIFFLTLLPLLPNMTMSFSVSKFASLKFIQRALATPERPESVLSFFFGVDYDDPLHKDILSDGKEVFEKMSSLWYMGGQEYDDLCKPFEGAIRNAGEGVLPWNDSVEKMMAQLILCDQLARNVFRGTPEAFLYEDTSISIASKLANMALTKDALVEPFCPPYYSFISVGLMHSEAKQDHEQCTNLLYKAASEAPHLQQFWDMQMKFEKEHNDVIEKFGRYPHRNTLKGRESTELERLWLADLEHLPSWALSQGGSSATNGNF